MEISMKISYVSALLLSLLFMQSNAMESENSVDPEIEELEKKAELLREERDTVFNDASQSGAIYMVMFKEFAIGTIVQPQSDSTSFLKLLHTWKAVPLTRRLIKIDKRIKAISKKNNPLNNNNNNAPAVKIVEIQTFNELAKDPSSYISKLELPHLNTINEDLVESYKAVQFSVDAFSEWIKRDINILKEKTTPRINPHLMGLQQPPKQDLCLIQ